MNQLFQKATEYVLSLQDKKTGGFSFAKGNKPTIMGTAYAIHCLEFLGTLNSLSEKEKSGAIEFLMKYCKEDGNFRDPLFDPSRIATVQHDESYFDGETTCFAQNALDALNAPPPKKRDFPKEILTKKGLRNEFDSYNWRDPHLNSNRVMFWLAQFCHEVERHGRNELIELIDEGLDWIDENQSQKTGLWLGPYEVNLSAAMAATFHYTFFYSYRNRPLKHLERIIDSCILLQRADGLFSRGNDIGQTCLDYDAIDLLAKASLITDYRSNDVQRVFTNAKDALLGLANNDGGFANVKEIWQGNKRVVSNKLYHTGLEICSCNNPESNSFSTWFRLLAYVLCQQDDWVKSNVENHPFIFRRLPWLGYHNVPAILNSYKGLETRRQSLDFRSISKNNEKISLSKKDIKESKFDKGKYTLVFPKKWNICTLNLVVNANSPQQAKITYKSKGIQKNIEWNSMQESIEKGSNSIFFIFANDGIENEILLDIFGDKVDFEIEGINLSLK